MCTVVRHQFNITISKSASAATVSWYISYNPLALSIYPQPVSFLLSRYFTFNSHTPLANVHIATGWHSSAKQKSHLISPFSFGLGHKVLFKKIKWEGIISEIIRSSTGCVSEAGGNLWRLLLKYLMEVEGAMHRGQKCPSFSLSLPLSLVSLCLFCLLFNFHTG